ncbi:MAG: S-adenosylmethionine--tRNA-ribosyltransferase-isomerase [Verrucomicrobia bacterium]|nr:S-adenosylmethionine--tRNA-ribosyltransferase-isomerase [Verrucomicrobiota bacterium]
MPPLATDLFDYDLPPHLIAQAPAERRDDSRLLVVDRAARTLAHRRFRDLPEFAQAGDTLFRNNASVLPARLHARRPSGGQVECFLLRVTASPETWRCLIRPGRKLPVGATFAHPTGAFAGTIVARELDGSAVVRFTTRDRQPIVEIARTLGGVPLPPYIRRDDESQRANDLERYQTVYANPARQVAVAAPTAGLHFTPQLLDILAAKGVLTAEVTLHVGLGTFKPILTDTIDAHEIHRELYELPATTVHALLHPPGRRIAVGTTTVRTIEDFLRIPSTDSDVAQSGEAGIFIYPPFEFRGVDALITNFHQPRSTLLCLVAAFLSPGSTDGIAWLREIYAQAIARDYRFFSYGDAMLIL